MTAPQIAFLIYFLFVCIHFNAAGVVGLLLGAIGIYGVFTNNTNIIGVVLIAIFAFHLVVKGLITKDWKNERRRNYSLIHIVLSAILFAVLWHYA